MLYIGINSIMFLMFSLNRFNISQKQFQFFDFSLQNKSSLRFFFDIIIWLGRDRRDKLLNCGKKKKKKLSHFLMRRYLTRKNQILSIRKNHKMIYCQKILVVMKVHFASWYHIHIINWAKSCSVSDHMYSRHSLLFSKSFFRLRKCPSRTTRDTIYIYIYISWDNDKWIRNWLILKIWRRYRISIRLLQSQNDSMSKAKYQLYLFKKSIIIQVTFEKWVK